MFKDNMFGSLIFFAIYFSEKKADGASKDFILPVILVVIVVLIFAVIGMYLTWKKEKFSFCRKKGNIDVDVIYRGFISFSGHEYNSIQEYIYPRKMFLLIHLMSRYTVHMVK